VSFRLARVGALLLVLLAGCSGHTGAPGDGAPGEEQPRNALTWTAGNEGGAFGYLVYRSDRREGPYRRVNERIVRVPWDGAAEHRYRWVDQRVEPGRTYYYYLDVVSENGIKQRFSGVISRTPPDADD